MTSDPFAPALRATLAVTGAFALLLAARSPAAEVREIRVPPDLEEAAELPQRRAAQLAARDGLEVFTGFRFTDRREASGIGFRHRIVDDAGLRYKAAHYDHGNGLAVADVDGDGLLDLYFTTQMGSNGLWKNLGGGKFRDVTGKAGVGMEGRVSVSASFADVDNDGDADLYVTTVRKGNALFLNDGKGTFRDATREAGLEYMGHSSAAVFFDYDRDGWLDLFLVNVGRYTTDEVGRGGYYVAREDAFAAHANPALSEQSVLYRNLGAGRFADASAATLLIDRSWSGDAAAADLDADGWPDLYVLNMQGDDHFWQNVEGEFFIDRTGRYFPENPAGTMGVEAFDWNHDGRLDLLLTDMHSDMIEDIGPEREKLKARRVKGDFVLLGVEGKILGNAFYESTGSGFREISDAIGAETYWPWGVSVDDLNADGWDDVFVAAGMNYPFRYGVNSVLLNERGQRFRDAEFILGVEPRADGMVQPWFEVDCAAAPRHRDCGDATGRVLVMAAEGSRSSAILDLDGDGDLDVVTNEFNDHPLVLVSDLAERRPLRYLKVELRGEGSNRDALGARVTVTAGGMTQTKVLDGKSGYLSQSRIPLYFGLGESERIERIEVVWPSGIRQVVDPPAVNTTLRVVEAEEAPGAEG